MLCVFSVVPDCHRTDSGKDTVFLPPLVTNDPRPLSFSTSFSRELSWSLKTIPRDLRKLRCPSSGPFVDDTVTRGGRETRKLSRELTGLGCFRYPRVIVQVYPSEVPVSCPTSYHPSPGPPLLSSVVEPE